MAAEAGLPCGKSHHHAGAEDAILDFHFEIVSPFLFVDGFVCSHCSRAMAPLPMEQDRRFLFG